MADGSFDWTARDKPLLQCVAPDRHLVARCPSCDRTTVCDPTPWVGEGLGGAPLRAFSDRMRCVCGSRRAVLEVEPGPFVEPGPEHEIIIFR